MKLKFAEYKSFDLSKINQEVLKRWKKDATFNKSLDKNKDNETFVFYEGPPSANGMPGIHHVMARTIKDVFCRYKTQQGYLVRRKAGWDTHGLPVELGVEKQLGITKEDIGKSVSVAEYNEKCREEVMKFTDAWEDLTEKMGYWINMDDPYITYDNRYIESVWNLLKKLFEKGLLYKGYTIQPYSPAAGTGLSTHELNQPGCYRDVKDTSCVAQFKMIPDEKSQSLISQTDTDIFFLAWTTTPWTLPSNTALAVGDDIKYAMVRTFNPYTGLPVTVILARDLVNVYFPDKNKDLTFDDYQPGDKKVPFKILKEFKGSEFVGIKYEQLIDWVKPDGDAFRIIQGDFVTTEEGTGIVHIAPTFGADDYRVAQQHDIVPLVIEDANGQKMPLVDKQGRFMPVDEMASDFVERFVNVDSYQSFQGRFVKNEYDDNLPDDAPAIDVDIAVMLKKENKAFRVEKYVHSYPHCWRTDKPVLYYPLDSWFVKTTAVKDRLIALNKQINWKPESTGSGRFGKWLENLVDWNLSRSRYWGTPLPVWVTEDKDEAKCIGSLAELKEEIEKSVKAGVMDHSPLEDFIEDDFSFENYSKFDLHRPYVDEVVLVTEDGRKMYREMDLIDVWFDSGAMPYAQLHYPFENKDIFEHNFPADFIAEGVDQTRGWFFTLHTIASMLFDSVAFKNIISNGLVLDKNGNKMSKRLGNAVDPFETIDRYGSDPLRWYMITNAQPWDNLKFDVEGIDEVKRKFFGTLFNTYSFFALYANVDGFTHKEKEIPLNKRPEIDRWIISRLNSLIEEVTTYYEDYEPTKAGRAIQFFVLEHLSNWYVRLNRKRFWGGGYDDSKVAAYQTLYYCLKIISQLAAPIAPFYMDQLYADLTAVTENKKESVHLSDFPVVAVNTIDKELEDQMSIAQRISSMVLALRRKVNIKVRQPLAKIMVPATDPAFIDRFEAVKDLILNEVNVKEVDYVNDTSGVLVKKMKPDFKKLGPKYGKLMKQISARLASIDQALITKLEQEGRIQFDLDGEQIDINRDEVDIISEDIPGWLVANEGNLTVALDVQVTDELREEGYARELVNKIQNLRKDNGYDVTDKIVVEVQANGQIESALRNFGDFIKAQTLANSIDLVDTLNENNCTFVELNDINTYISIDKS